MPDISELNGTAIDNVAEFDGLTVTLIPAAAYSVRLLGSAFNILSYTGPAMRIRRVTGVGNTGNDDEADVAFDTSLATPTISLDSPVSNFSAGGSNATTLGEFLNVGTVPPYNGGLAFSDPDNLVNTASCFVNSWKDQSGNANHAEQTTPASQPQIHSGTVDTDLITENGKPALDFDGSDDGLNFTSTGYNINNLSTFVVARQLGTVQGRMVFAMSGSTGLARWYAPFSTGTFDFGYGNSPNAISATRTTNQSLFSMIAGSTQTDCEAWINATSAGTTALQSASTSNQNGIGSFNGGFESDCNVQEVLIWGADQSSNRTAIESNINGFFGIY